MRSSDRRSNGSHYARNAQDPGGAGIQGHNREGDKRVKLPERHRTNPGERDGRWARTNPSCSRASGSGLRGIDPFSRRVPARGLIRRSPPACIRLKPSVRLRFVPPAPETIGSMPSPAGGAARTGKLDHRLAQAAIARLRDPLIPFDAPALPGAGRQSSICRHLASVAEAAEQRFQPEERRELGAQAFELESRAAGWSAPRLPWDERVAGAFDPASGVVTSAIRSSSRRISASHRRQLTPVAGPQRLEPFDDLAEAGRNPRRLPPSRPLTRLGCRMRSLSSVPRSRVNRRDPLLPGRRANDGTDPAPAARPCHQRPQQPPAVDRSRSCAPMPPVHRYRSRIDHVALDPSAMSKPWIHGPSIRFLDDDRFDPHAVALLAFALYRETRSSRPSPPPPSTHVWKTSRCPDS